MELYILLIWNEKDTINFGTNVKVPSIVWEYIICSVYAPKQKHSHQFTTFLRGTVFPIFGQPYDTSQRIGQSNPQATLKF